MKSSGIEIICRSVEELSEPIRVHGASGAANALIIARIASALGGDAPWVVICRDDDSCAELAADIETLGEQVVRGSVPVCQFPTWEQSPYSPIAPSIRTRLGRLAVMSEIVQGRM